MEIPLRQLVKTVPSILYQLLMSITGKLVIYTPKLTFDTGKLEWGKLHLSDQNMGQCALAVGEDGTIYVSSKGEE